MATPATIQCNTCGTQFSEDDVSEAQNHAGHAMVRIDPGGSPPPDS